MPTIADITSNPSLKFDPETAAAISRHCNSAADAFSNIRTNSQLLVDAGSAGSFHSASEIQKDLGILGGLCNSAVKGFADSAQALGDAVREAGQRIVTQDWATSATLNSTTAKADGYPAIGASSAGAQACLLTDPDKSDKNLGPFPCNASMESTPGGGVVDWGFINTQPANSQKLTELVKLWMMVARDINATAEVFQTGIAGLFASGTWTGTAANAIHQYVDSFAKATTQAGQDAFTNSLTVSAWVTGVLSTRTGFEGLKQQKEAEALAPTNAAIFTPAAMAQQQAAMQRLDQAGRDLINTTYNPAVTQTSSGLLNLPDPNSPPGALVPLFAPGSRPGPVSSPGLQTSSNYTSPSGGTGGSGGSGGGPGGSGGKPASDAAQTLSRQGTGDPAAAAASNASKNAAAQSGQGSPASAAQSAMSKAGDTAKGLGGKSGASPLTRSAGLGSIADAEKSAAAKAASALGKGGGGAGGGGAGGGGGIGKMGGAGIAAAEGSLSARSAAGLSAAERAMAAPQAAPAAGRAGMGSGAPMGGARGGQGSENEKEHKSARYLISEENGEEIAGELPDTAPPVLGGLNLDTTDNPDTTR
ncbi:hypothetical protein [Williamsia maris]|nr:hypothetical protein [Williamsia maris]